MRYSGGITRISGVGELLCFIAFAMPEAGFVQQEAVLNLLCVMPKTLKHL